MLIAGIVFGLGSGFAFVPANINTFATLPADHRPNGTSLFSLMMNIGGSLGVSVVVTNLVRDAQINHARLAEHITPFTELSRHVTLPRAWDVAEMAGRAAMNAEVSRQSLMIAYANDFKLLAFFSLIFVALGFFFRMPKTVAARED